ncbi:hypothetical protein RIR_jg11369.t1 [Rhizophagus irregularis DAOM 181602=DAOM 197198]|nr:hypothetical protein RIR_jg11369.t1 [Rhizophagus irregularis DAOM 181602=DAOM 197198]
MDLEGKFKDDVFRLGKTNRSSWGNKFPHQFPHQFFKLGCGGPNWLVTQYNFVLPNCPTTVTPEFYYFNISKTTFQA